MTPRDNNLLHNTSSLDVTKPLRHQRTSSDVTDIIKPIGSHHTGLSDSKPVARPAGHAPGLRLNTMRQLPPLRLRRHSIADAPHVPQFERPHNPPPE